MSKERRYNEQEIAAIFERAAAEEAAAGETESGGLTRGELAHIAQEVGISPEALARALSAVEQPSGDLTSTQFVGVPVGIVRTLERTGTFTEEDWNALVLDLHRTFGQPGETRQIGRDRRAWQNDQLHVYAEPTPTGYRLQFRTAETQVGLGKSLLGTNIVFIFMGLFFTLLVALKDNVDLFSAKMLFVSMLAVLGAAGYGLLALRLPRRNKALAAQIEHVLSGVIKREAATAAPSPLPMPPALDLDLAPEREQEAEPPSERRRNRTRE